MKIFVADVAGVANGAKSYAAILRGLHLLLANANPLRMERSRTEDDVVTKCGKTRGCVRTARK